jgi:hypothetical protein
LGASFFDPPFDPPYGVSPKISPTIHFLHKPLPYLFREDKVTQADGPQNSQKCKNEERQKEVNPSKPAVIPPQSKARVHNDEIYNSADCVNPKYCFHDCFSSFIQLLNNCSL